MGPAKLTEAAPGREGIGTALLTMVVVLLADLPALLLAVYPLVPESTGGPDYSYAREYSWLLSISLLYSGGALTLGLYWQRRYRRTARLVGIGLGILPVLAVAASIATQWVVAGSKRIN